MAGQLGQQSGPQAFFELTLSRAKARLIDDRQRVTQAVLNSANHNHRTQNLTETSTHVNTKFRQENFVKAPVLFEHPISDQTFGHPVDLKDGLAKHMRRRHTAPTATQSIDGQVAKTAAVPGAIPSTDRSKLPLT